MWLTVSSPPRDYSPNALISLHCHASHPRTCLLERVWRSSYQRLDSTWAWHDRRPGSRHILRGRRRGCPLWCRKACNSDWSQGFQREWVRRSSSRYCPRRAILSATYCRSGTLSDVVSGFNYVLQTSKSTGRPSVALFAGGGAVGSTSLRFLISPHINVDGRLRLR